MSTLETRSNPDLTVGPDNKQRWNQPAHRRHGFHNAHQLFRRALMVRARDVLILQSAQRDLRGTIPGLGPLLAHPAFSALCCLRGGRVIMEQAAPDFSTRQPHSIQSISKRHIHLIIGRLLAEGRISLNAKVSDYLPDIGSGYREARVQALMDMSVTNDFTEDYADPNADCYAEEVALGWRLPGQGQVEVSLADFATAITGFVPGTGRVAADYKSANTDVLTLIAAKLSPIPLAAQIEQIADAVGYEGAFHISLSRDGLPAFSGGGCLSARDLARFGLFLGRAGTDLFGKPCANAAFLRRSLTRSAPSLTPPKAWLRYSNQLMTDGRVIAHAGYAGQFLMVDTATGTSCAFFSVLENDAGYDEAYMGQLAAVLRQVCCAEMR